jgi:hypothetical protein
MGASEVVLLWLGVRLASKNPDFADGKCQCPLDAHFVVRESPSRHNDSVISVFTLASIRFRPPFQGGGTGSNPVGGAS